jgi:hypothetical protein
MKAGIAGTTAPYVLISMADGSDEAHVVDPMVALARAGADLVSASRYMRGGHQVVGPQASASTGSPGSRPMIRQTTSSSTVARSSTLRRSRARPASSLRSSSPSRQR